MVGKAAFRTVISLFNTTKIATPVTIPAAGAKTICLTAKRQPDPEVVAAMADADTASCRSEDFAVPYGKVPPPRTARLSENPRLE
jgi:hypothetical protein